MSASYKELVSRSKHGSKDAKLELTSRASQYIDTTLKGISDESIVFRKSSDILESVRYISSEIGNIKNDKSYTDIIILDAYSSATIEGARTTVENVKRCVSNPYTKDDKMVVNTMTAQKFVYDNGINASNIRHIWEVLVNDVCENYRLRGTLYRSGMVYVGNSFRVIHIPEKAENIKFRMNSLFKFCDTWKDSIIKACIVHFYFVYIHPFCDVNGRMARV